MTATFSERTGLTSATPSSLTMKELTFDGPVPSDVYHGAKMNQKALDFHTQLHEWSEAQKLVTKHTQMLTANRPNEVYLPIKKIASIEYWQRQVNRYYKPHRNGHVKTDNFMKIDVTKYNMKVNNKEDESKRSKSAMFPQRLAPAVDTPGRASTGKRRTFFGTDMHSIKNKIIESQMHYSAQRRNLYSGSTGRKPATKERHVEEEQDEGLDMGVSEIGDYDKLENSSSETVTIIDQTDGSKVTDLDTISQGQSHIEADVMQPQIVTRSWSNRMLNVISIDDCKLTCRYRPQVIKENRNMPNYFRNNAKSAPSHVHQNAANNVHQSVPNQVHSKQNGTHKPVGHLTAIKVNDMENTTGHEADDEADVSTDTINDVQESLNEIHMNAGGDGIEANHEGVGGSSNTNGVEGIVVNTEGEGTLNSVINAYACHIREEDEDELSTSGAENDCSTDNNLDSKDKPCQPMTNGGGDSTDHTESSHSKCVRINENKMKGKEDAGTPTLMGGNFSSRGTSKTSYGRVTALTLNTEASKAWAKARKKKRATRASRINRAINDVVKDRRVMNSRERDFDVRTQQFGRTVIETTDGSNTFKKIHANLRKKIDLYMDAHTAINTKDYRDMCRKNSASSSINPKPAQ